VSEKKSPLGLIAGQGTLPLLVAQGMRDRGHRVCCIGLRDQFDPALPELCDEFRTVGLVQLGRWMRLLRRAGVEKAVMVGRVEKARMHDPFKLFRQLPDWRALKLWYRRLRHDRRNAALLAAVADELATSGITLIDSTAYIPDHLATAGVMGRVQPNEWNHHDVDFGWPLLTQTVAELETHLFAFDELGEMLHVAADDLVAFGGGYIDELLVQPELLVEMLAQVVEEGRFAHDWLPA